MRTRKKGVKKHKKYRTCFKIYKGGRSSSSDRASDDPRRVVSIGQPKTASPKKSTPKAASPRAASPKKSTPRRKASWFNLSKIVPLHKLKGRGRDRRLPYIDNIHSEDDGLHPEKTEGVESSIRHKLDLLESTHEKIERNTKRLERRMRASTPPPPPPIELSPSGDGLITTYTPELNILDIGLRIPVVHGKPLETTLQYVMTPFEYKYHRLLPLSFLTKKQVSLQTKEEAEMIKYIELFPKTYTYLSPILFYSLMDINRVDLFGRVLVLGKLRDDLIPIIALSSVDVVESRLFTTRDETIHIIKNMEQNLIKKILPIQINYISD